MNSIVLDSVGKIFCHRPTLFNWFGNEREGATRALDDVSLKVAAGDILVILGPNGSGKTTTLKLISTLLLPDSGQVFVNGFEPRKHSNEVRRRVSFAIASERSFFPRLSARENLDFFAALDDVPRSQRASRIADLLDYTGLSEAADMLVMKFSSGMYQRLAIARALLKCPSVILLDEPTRSLDPAAAIDVTDLVRRLSGAGTTVVVATHSFAEAAALNANVLILLHGRVVARLQSATHDPDWLRDFYFHATGEIGRLELAQETVA
jgi:ABC-2 type transport system ATP-binding protein